jgi:hypothetical protein
MADTEHQKQHIEIAIERARDGVSNRIDELDRVLREKLDVTSAAADKAPQIIAGGAVVGFLVGFGFPKVIKTALKLGIPLAVAAFAIKKAKDGGER